MTNASVAGRGGARYVGKAVQRTDAPRLLTGRGQYVGDLVLPGMLHLAFVRSPHAHARIRSIDLDAARALPGVAAVLTGREAAGLSRPWKGILAHYAGMKSGEQQALAVDVVRYVGEPVVAVAASSRYVAEDACDLVAVEYEPLPPVVDWRTRASRRATGSPTQPLRRAAARDA